MSNPILSAMNKLSLLLIKFFLPLSFLTPRGDDYTLVWSDEFNTGTAPDTTNWTHEQGFVRNHEFQWYQPGNASCAGGILTIEARREHKANPYYQAGSNDWKKKNAYIEYTSSSISTEGKKSWMYGRFELRARIDTSMGLWPAWWTLGLERTWPSNGEIDMMEYYRQNLLANIAKGTATPYKAHWFSNKKPISSFADHADWASKFHVWRMDWTEQEISLWVNGELLNKQAMTDLYDLDSTHFHPFRQPHYMLLNMAVGGDNGGDPNASPSPFPKKYEIDWVRVYKSEP